MAETKIVVVGGGSGSHNVLTGLVSHPVDPTAIVAMSDSGGSSGRLRDELDQLPWGDVRQCLVALAGTEWKGLVRDLFAHRFVRGEGLTGHSVGNLMLTALTEITGGPEHAINAAAKLLNIHGRVLPVTLTDTHLNAILTDGTLLEREATIDTYGGTPGVRIERVYLNPSARAHSPVLQAIEDADLLVLSPGDLYTSLIPNLLVEGVSNAILQTNAKVVLILNLMTKPGETDGFRASTIINEVDRYLGETGRVNVLLANSDPMPDSLLQRYARENAFPLPFDVDDCEPLVGTIVARPLTAQTPFLRHDPQKLAQALMELISAQSSRNGAGSLEQQPLDSTTAVEQ